MKYLWKLELVARKGLIIFQQENSSCNSKKILIKIGSALTKHKEKFNYSLIKKKVKEISQLMQQHKIILVTSGAVACGMEILKVKEKPKDILSLQMLSGIGQAALISSYKKMFAKEGIKIAQVLLTHHNFISKKERKTIIKIIESYLALGILPVINENDLINKEELKYKKIFTDNDMLSAILAKELKVDLTLILTNVSGLYNKNPQEKDAKLIKKVKEINNLIKKLANGNNPLGTGGMLSKINAAELMNMQGIDVIVGNGSFSLFDLINNPQIRTIFKSNNLNNHNIFE